MRTPSSSRRSTAAARSPALSRPSDRTTTRGTWCGGSDATARLSALARSVADRSIAPATGPSATRSVRNAPGSLMRTTFPPKASRRVASPSPCDVPWATAPSTQLIPSSIDRGSTLWETSSTYATAIQDPVRLRTGCVIARTAAMNAMARVPTMRSICRGWNSMRVVRRAHHRSTTAGNSSKGQE